MQPVFMAINASLAEETVYSISTCLFCKFGLSEHVCMTVTCSMPRNRVTKSICLPNFMSVLNVLTFMYCFLFYYVNVMYCFIVILKHFENTTSSDETPLQNAN